MTTLTLADLRKRLNALPSMSAVRAELLQYLAQDNIDLPHVVQLVERDQVISAKALRIANSPFFGLSREIDSIKQAVTLLGLHSVHSVALTTAVMDCVKPASDTAWFKHAQYWQHSIGVALCAQALAQRSSLNGASAFTAGLLHDIGRLVLVSCAAQDYRRACEGNTGETLPLAEAERQAMGFDHADVGELLAQHWKLPPQLSDCMALHHRPEDARATPMVYLVHVADALAHALDLCGDPQECVPAISTVAWNSLNIDWRDANALFSQIEQRFAQISHSLPS